MGQIYIYRNLNGVLEKKSFEIGNENGYEEKIKQFTYGLKELNKKW